MQRPDDALPEELEKQSAPFIAFVGQVFGRRGEPPTLEEVQDEAIAHVFERLQLIKQQQTRNEGATQASAPVREWPGRENVAGGLGSRRSFPRSRWQPALSLIAACLVLSLLVGSMIVVENAIRKQPALSPGARDKQALIWGYSGPAVTTLDPALASNRASVNVIQLVFASLVQSGRQNTAPDGSLLATSPQLAVSWNSSLDELSWTFNLRKGLTFSDGTPITSQDIAYSLDRALSPSLISQGGNGLTYLSLIRGANARANGTLSTIIGTGIFTPDPLTIRIEITHPSLSFLDTLSSPAAAVVEKHLVDTYGAAWSQHLNEGGASGPFKVQSWQHNATLTVVPNTHYPGLRARANKVAYVPYRDEASLYQAFQAGRIDVANVTPDQYQAARTNSAFTASLSFQLDYVGMNYQSRPFDNSKVRQALSLAIDRQAFNQHVNNGAFIPTCHLIPQGMQAYNPALNCPDLKGDPAQAKTLLQEGLQEENLSPAVFQSLTLAYPLGSEAGAMALKARWQEVLGISLRLAPVEQTALAQQILQTAGHTGPLQIWLSSRLPTSPDPSSMTLSLFGRNQPFNAVNYGQNNSATATIQQHVQNQMLGADSIEGRPNGTSIYTQIEQQLVSDVAWLPLDQQQEDHLIRKNIHGLAFDPLGQIPPDAWAGICMPTTC